MTVAKPLDVPRTGLRITRLDGKVLILRGKDILRMDWNGARLTSKQSTGLTEDEIVRCERALRSAK